MSPAFTFTAVTVPDDVKLRSSVWAASTVPSADTVSLIDPLVTVTSCFVVVVDEADALSSERKPNHHVPSTTTTAADTMRYGFRSDIRSFNAEHS